ncbi:hypothetical protein OFY05_21165 [Pseudocitrobacter faecalis]|nr:hypothetical protein OFY05_21165 [Pseudocitrobacter faecalis]
MKIYNKTYPIEIVYQSLTSLVSPWMAKPEHVQGICSCCQRPAEEFGFQGYKLLNSYRQPVTHCPQCQTFFASVPEIMGLENPRRTSAQKFGMWPGVGAIIDIQACSAVLLAPPGVVNKLPPAFFDKVNVVTATGSQQPEYLFSADLRYPLIYIRDFGRKTYELVRSLRVSYSGDAVYACEDTLMTRTNEITFVLNMNQAKALFEQMKMLNQSEVRAFFRTVEFLARGRISPAEASREFLKNNTTHLVGMLPPDPHQRINMIRQLQKVS